MKQWTHAALVALGTCVATSGILAPGGTAAQQRLNVAESPNFGERNVAPGFTPDPIEIDVTSGGPLNVAFMNLGNGCTGYATSQPDVNVRLSGTSNFLRFFFEGGGQDATLIINLPDGSWVCNDDAVGRDPMIDLRNAGPGLYNIWVGSYSASDRIRGKLKITEMQNVRPGGGGVSPPPAPPPTGSNVGARLDPNARPNFGVRQLAAGFTPDPVRINVTSGGAIDASTLGLGPDCRGWVSRQPDFNLRLMTDSSFLRFFVDRVQQRGDTTLIVNTADGRWECNDDSFNTRNPTVDIPNAPAGVYNVWVGSFREGVMARGRLSITELQTHRPR
jgi:serine protease Do